MTDTGDTADTAVPDNGLERRRIIVGVSGGIAAYKSPMLVRRLRDAGADVQVVMTRGAQQFVTATTLQAVSGRPVRDSLWDAAAEAAMGHIELARWAELILIAPATADLISRLALGRADDLLCTLRLASEAPLLLAPAMNRVMWQHPATQRNLATLRADGAHIVGPEEGPQACGEYGPGRMSEPEVLSARAGRLLAGAPSAGGPLTGVRVLITAGPTREAIDPVRYISNHSSGKQGFALAAAARDAGAEVVLVSGPVNLATPAGVRRIDVESAEDMQQAVQGELDGCGIFIAVAAVADYRPEHAAEQKIKKSSQARAGLTLQLVENPDIVASVARRPDRPFVVGFAAETQDALHNARDKRARKGMDMIVVNDVSRSGIGFNSDANAVTVIWEGGEESVAQASKAQVAAAVIARVADRYVRRLANANPASVAK
ncbi:MAG: bifunctional phosphopantothenoylcysteine decarboxylase/phosphopantothenate--cysteine ligase CoaBC [Pseudomonadales bacterium]